MNLDDRQVIPVDEYDFDLIEKIVNTSTVPVASGLRHNVDQADDCQVVTMYVFIVI